MAPATFTATEKARRLSGECSAVGCRAFAHRGQDDCHCVMGIAFCIGSERSACGFIRYVRASVSAVLDCNNICQFRSNPNNGCDKIYLKNTMAEEEHPDCFGELSKEEVVLSDGTDVAETVENAEKWLIQYNCG